MASADQSAEQQIYNFLKTQGFSEAGIAGLMGNEQVESSFSPTANNPRENAWGLSQWEGGRLPALQSFARSQKLDWKSLQAQLEYTIHEMKNSYPDVYDYLKTATDPSEAAAYVDANYEMSSGSSRQQRESDANAIYSQVRSNEPLTMGGQTAQLASWNVPIPGVPSIPIPGTGGSIGGGSVLGITLPGIPDIGSAFTKIEQFFEKVLWIFNMDHFVKFLLYTWGAIFIVGGLIAIGVVTEKETT